MKDNTEQETTGAGHENDERGVDLGGEEDDGLDDWGNEAEKFEVNGIKVYAYRNPIVAMRVGLNYLEDSVNDEEVKLYQCAEFLSVMSDGGSFGGELIKQSELTRISLLPAPQNSYHVVFDAPQFEDLLIEGRYEFNGIRGNWKKHVRSSVEQYLREKLAESEGQEERK